MYMLNLDMNMKYMMWPHQVKKHLSKFFLNVIHVAIIPEYIDVIFWIIASNQSSRKIDEPLRNEQEVLDDEFLVDFVKRKKIERSDGRNTVKLFLII